MCAQKSGRETSADDELRDTLGNMKGEGSLLTAEQTADKLTQLLIDGSYSSGDFVDYFDG